MSTNYDEQIETALKALQQAEPDDAMQGRILSALETAQSNPVGSHRWSNSALSSAAVPWLAAAALLLVAGGTLFLHRNGPGRTHPNQGILGSGIAVAHKGKSSLPFEVGYSDKPASASSSATPARVPHVLQRHGIQLQAAAETHVSEARRGEPAALADNRSFPAPPLPLTEQERLLLRLASREPPQQLAQLTSAALNTGFQQEKEAVTEFFAPRPPLPGQQEPPSYVLETGQQ